MLNEAAASPHLHGFVYITAQHGLARLAALDGAIEQSRAVLAHALAYSAERHLLPEYVRTAIEIARIERDFGDPREALLLLEAAAELAEQFGIGSLATVARALLARLTA